MNESDEETPETLASMLLKPYHYFPAPQDVVDSKMLNKTEKLSVLKAMEHEARELQVASEENMGGGENRSLAAVVDAIRAVDPEAAERLTGNSKTF